MSTTDKQGVRANKTGESLEEFVSGLIEKHGYRYIESALFAATRCMEQPIYSKQYPIGNDIYERARRCDFILYHPTKYPNNLIIESKWQQVGGSVDEKLPFLSLTIQKSSIETAVVLDGGGYSSGAEEWLRKQVRQVPYLQHVFNMKEFQKFANDDKL